MKYLFIIFLCVACGGDDLKKVENLEGFRVLGIMTSTPEVAPGATVSDLKILFSDVGSGGRAITGNATGCIDPGISRGAPVDCSLDPGRVTQQISFDTGADDETNGFFTGLSPAVGSFTIPTTIFAGRSSREQFNGVGYIIKFDLDIGASTVSSYKRIIVTNRSTLNSNPSGGQMLLNGRPITTSPGEDDEISVTNSSQEAYQFINLDGDTESLREKYEVAWYVSNGELDKPKSLVSENVKYLDDKVSGGYLQIAVIRDERGGMQYLLFNQ